ncbi:hypothetical protein R1flu_005711 [Riccia fluitans]|uniref:Uncharacterized protein n=1 Tax=Riccia fluitans TaxID=41844 RepID=A0ABD1YTY7_9MARC
MMTGSIGVHELTLIAELLQTTFRIPVGEEASLRGQIEVLQVEIVAQKEETAILQAEVARLRPWVEGDAEIRAQTAALEADLVAARGDHN